jgi:hypothetical protein
MECLLLLHNTAPLNVSMVVLGIPRQQLKLTGYTECQTSTTYSYYDCNLT